MEKYGAMKICLPLLALFFALSSSAQVQWASGVIEFSSQYDTKEFSSKEILGPPNCMPQGGENASAWSPQKPGGKAQIKVSFKDPQPVRQIIVAENFNPGKVTRIILYDTENREHEAYRSKPQELKDASRMLHVKIDLTEYKVRALMLEVNMGKGRQLVNIDAVGIAAGEEEYRPAINLALDVKHVESKENLGDKVNSTYTELAPVISPDGKKLFFARMNDPTNPNGMAQDIMHSELQADGTWSPAENAGSPLNNALNNFVCSVTPDGNTLLLGGVYNTDSTMSKGVSITHKTASGWEFPKQLSIRNFSNASAYNEYALSGSGKILVMAIERDDTEGDKDLYVSFLSDDGTWTEPVNLGTTVNTAGAEVSPFIAADDRTLYFSSKGFPGYGNSDIFITRRLDSTWTKWSEPQNLGPLVNTADWDGYYTVTASGDWAYVVSKHRAMGSTDIFRIALPKEVKPDPVVMMSGRVLNSRTKQPVTASITYIDLDNGKEAGIASSDPVNGSYKIVLPAGKKYGFLAVAGSFISISDNIDLSGLKEYTEMTSDLLLSPIETGDTFRLNNIFFDAGKVTLLPSSYNELDRLVSLLIKYPLMKIEVAGHADNIGSDAINLALSRKRAKAVTDHLVSKGIDTSRLRSEGYGESRPAASNETEKGRQLNRRIEFIIINM